MTEEQDEACQWRRWGGMRWRKKERGVRKIRRRRKLAEDSEDSFWVLVQQVEPGLCWECLPQEHTTHRVAMQRSPPWGAATAHHEEGSPKKREWNRDLVVSGSLPAPLGVRRGTREKSEKGWSRCTSTGTGTRKACQYEHDNLAVQRAVARGLKMVRCRLAAGQRVRDDGALWTWTGRGSSLDGNSAVTPPQVAGSLTRCSPVLCCTLSGRQLCLRAKIKQRIKEL